MGLEVAGVEGGRKGTESPFQVQLIGYWSYTLEDLEGAHPTWMQPAMFNGKPRAGSSRQFPVSREFPVAREFPIPREIPEIWEISGREISQASREGGNGNFPLNITGCSFLVPGRWRFLVDSSTLSPT